MDEKKATLATLEAAEAQARAAAAARETRATAIAGSSAPGSSSTPSVEKNAAAAEPLCADTCGQIFLADLMAIGTVRERIMDSLPVSAQARLRRVCLSFDEYARSRLELLNSVVVCGGLVVEDYTQPAWDNSRGPATGRRPPGREPDDSYHASREVYALQPRTMQWEQLPHLPKPRFAHACCRLSDGSIMVAGGIEHASELAFRNPGIGTEQGHHYEAGGRESSDEGYGHSECGDAVDSVEMFRPENNRWENLTAMPVAVAGAAACTLPASGDVLVVGGNVSDEDLQLSTSKTSYMYSRGLSVWTELDSRMHQGRADFGFVATNEGFLVIGGTRSTRAAAFRRSETRPGCGLLTAEYFCFKTKQWFQLPQPDSIAREDDDADEAYAERHGCAAALLDDGRVVVIGGLYHSRFDRHWCRSSSVVAFNIKQWECNRAAVAAAKAAGKPTPSEMAVCWQQIGFVSGESPNTGLAAFRLGRDSLLFAGGDKEDYDDSIDLAGYGPFHSTEASVRMLDPVPPAADDINMLKAKTLPQMPRGIAAFGLCPFDLSQVIDRSTFKEHHQKGLACFESGEYAAALQEYTKAVQTVENLDIIKVQTLEEVRAEFSAVDEDEEEEEDEMDDEDDEDDEDDWVEPDPLHERLRDEGVSASIIDGEAYTRDELVDMLIGLLPADNHVEFSSRFFDLTGPSFTLGRGRTLTELLPKQRERLVQLWLNIAQCALTMDQEADKYEEPRRWML